MEHILENFHPKWLNVYLMGTLLYIDLIFMNISKPSLYLILSNDSRISYHKVFIVYNWP